MSKLIDWLGNEIEDLHHYISGDTWRALGKKPIFYEGKTPLDAVYNLALAVKGEK